MSSDSDNFIATGPQPEGNLGLKDIIAFHTAGDVGYQIGVEVFASNMGVYGRGAARVGVFGQAGLLDGPAAHPFGQGGIRFPLLNLAGVIGTSDIFPGVIGTSRGVGVYGQSGALSGTVPAGLPSAGVIGAAEAANGVTGWSRFGGDGVFGQCDGIGFGVHGVSTRSYGVFGQIGNPGPFVTSTATTTTAAGLRFAGVFGTSTDAIGTMGTSYTKEGVLGFSRDAAGVSGTSQKAPGVIGGSGLVGVFGVSGAFVGAAGWSLDPSGTGVLGISGKAGPSLPAPFKSAPAAVIATSDLNPGVISASQANSGVIGFSAKNIGMVGITQNPASYAGYFQGNVHMTGTLSSDSVKGAVVPFPDGTKRLLVCMESPEPWFEDFGAGKLKRGRATVKLDADFAKVITLNDYCVFLTPEGDCQGLFVRKHGKSFEVRELQGGTSSVAFSYRIVGKRKDIKGHKRFAKIEVPAPISLAKARATRGRKAAQAPSSIPALLTKLEKHARTALQVRAGQGPRDRSRGRKHLRPSARR
jgi:hypothetical protein